MSTAATLPSPQEAHDTVCDIHKRAFLGRLAQHGEQPATEKEATALLDLGISLYESAPAEEIKTAQDNGAYGDGPYAQVLAAYTNQNSPQAAPGFESVKQSNSTFGKEGSTDHPLLPQPLLDSAMDAAVNLAQDPSIYGAAVVKRACNEEAMVEQIKQAETTE